MRRGDARQNSVSRRPDGWRPDNDEIENSRALAYAGLRGRIFTCLAGHKADLADACRKILEAHGK
jgi:hypothetical protein